MTRRELLALAAASTAWGFEDEVEAILKRIQPPKFPNRDFVITKFGAKETGDSIASIRDAVAACAKAGGGRVVVPPGSFESGAIHLKSGVNLHISKGATLRFSR